MKSEIIHYMLSNFSEKSHPNSANLIYQIFNFPLSGMKTAHNLPCVIKTRKKLK